MSKQRDGQVELAEEVEKYFQTDPKVAQPAAVKDKTAIAA